MQKAGRGAPYVALVFTLVVLVPSLVASGADDPSVGRWTSEGGGPSHSGFYPATLGSGPITAGWSQSYGREINRVAISDGRVFVTATNMPVRGDTGHSFIAALDTSSGQELWRSTLPAPADVPIVDGDTVLVEAEPSWAVYALRCADGAIRWIHPFAGIVRTNCAAAVGDQLWIGYGSALVGMRISDNAIPTVEGVGASGLERVSYYAGVIYASDGQAITAIEPGSGATLWTMPHAFGSPTFSTDVLAIANGKASSIADRSALSTVDLQTHSLVWKVSDYGFTGVPATDGGAVYAHHRMMDQPNGAMSIRAYEAETGALAGEYMTTGQAADEEFITRAQPLVTNDTVFLATTRATYVFDKVSCKLRAKLPAGGFLSFAAGTLYVADPAGNLLTYKFESAAAEAPPAAWPSPTPPLPPPKTDVEIVSINDLGTATASGSSGISALSADGRYVLFESDAADVTPQPDVAGTWDLFLRDRQSGTVRKVGTNPSDTPVMSSDGRRVAFINGGRVYVTDVQAGTTTFLGFGQKPLLSRDGSHVVWSNGTVSVRDLTANTTVSASAGYVNAYGYGISADGRYVLFCATGTSQAAFPGGNQCFVYDVVNQTTSLVTTDVSGAGTSNGAADTPRISDDGQYVVFASSATNLVPPDQFGGSVYRRDMRNGRTECLATGKASGWVADISADAQVVVIMTDRYFSAPVYVVDKRADTVTKLPLYSPVDMDATGRRIVCAGYVSSQPADINSSSDVFLYDRDLDSTKLISHNLAGTSSLDGMAQSAIISDDGQTVGFSSTGSDLVATPKFTYGAGGTHFDAYVSTSARTAKLLNISTRGEVAPGDGALIGGFIIGGGSPKEVLLRALGPSLAAAGVADALPNPTLELRDSAGSLIAANDDWVDNQAAITAIGLPPTDPSESALVRTLTPGAYTGIVRGVAGAAGVALFEAYDVNQTAGSNLANISTRAVVGADDQVLIGGFVVGDPDGGSAKVLVRALGPSLSAVGIANSLADPILELRDANGAGLGSNDDWKTSQQAEIEATGIQPGNDAESALLTTLSPGLYTAIVRGKTAVAGVGLVEIYQLE